jgi:hypothetical protein
MTDDLPFIIAPPLADGLTFDMEIACLYAVEALES